MHAILIYGFPLILLLFEWGLRTLLSVDASAFVGPTLATAGLSFLVPLTKPKYLNIPVEFSPGAIVISKADNNFIAVVWIFLLLYLFVWASSCYFSVKLPASMTWGLSTQFLIGISAYLVSLVMTFVKEKV